MYLRVFNVYFLTTHHQLTGQMRLFKALDGFSQCAAYAIFWSYLVLHAEYLTGSVHSVMVVSWRPILGSVGS